MEKEEIISLLEEREDLLKIEKSLQLGATVIHLKISELNKKLQVLVEDKYVGKWFKSPYGTLFYVLEQFPKYPAVRGFYLLTSWNTQDKACFDCRYGEVEISELETKFEKKNFDADIKRVFIRFGKMIEETWDGKTRHNIRINPLKIQ